MTEPRTDATFSPPVPAARRWLKTIPRPEDLPLINVSQAAPVDPPPRALREVIADAALNTPEAHLYGPVHGLPALREEVAKQWSHGYHGQINADQVCITSGCNQAFCTAIALLCGEEDEVILPTPWYFNHKMALDMAGIRTVPLRTDADLLPNPEKALHLITERTRAICLVSPNNPGGVEYPAELISEFARLAREKGIALILDETYRDFHSRNGAPHNLFQDPDWHDTLIQLYSFSKSFRLTGHRVGAMIASRERLSAAEKFLDTHTICPNQLGQIAALWGMQNLGDWLAGERQEIVARRAAIETHMPQLTAAGWQLRGVGAYFAYLRHPFDLPSDKLAQKLLSEAAVLALPGTMFTPENDPDGARDLRIAFANIDTNGIAELMRRLAAIGSTGKLALAPGIANA